MHINTYVLPIAPNGNLYYKEGLQPSEFFCVKDKENKELEHKNAELKREGKPIEKKAGYPSTAPQFTGNPNFKAIYFTVSSEATHAEKTEEVRQKYLSLVKESKFTPGAFGNLVQVQEIKQQASLLYRCAYVIPAALANIVLMIVNLLPKLHGFGNLINPPKLTLDEKTTLVITQIGRNAYPTPALAADAPIFLKGKGEDNQDHIYWLGIIRGGNPGKDKPAVIGGFDNIDRNREGIEYLASTIHTVIAEVAEEGGVNFKPSIPLEQLETDYNLPEMPGELTIEGKPHKAFISQGGMYATHNDPIAQGGESYPDGTKRVHATRVATITADLGATLINEAKIRNWFLAGTDAKELHVFDVTKQVKFSVDMASAGKQARDFHRENGIGIKHHEQVMADGFHRAYLKLFKK